MTSNYDNSAAVKSPIPLWVWAMLPALVTLGVYLSVLGNGFVNWDDPVVIQNNLHIRNLGPSSVQWLFSNFLEGFYTPLTWVSLALDYWIGGLDPWVFHFHNLLLHALNTTLVFFLGRKILALGGQGGAPAIDGARIQSSAFMAALLFGLHPLEVETVAWVTCRKDLLCTFFFFASLLVYLDYAAKSQPKLWKLVSSLVCYGLALLCKPMAVTLPLVLILLDGWPLKRWKHGFLRPVLEKTPFFFLALLSGIMTIKAEYGVNAVASLNVVPLGFRVMNAFHSLAFYLAKIIGPFGLCTLYPVHLKRMFSPGYVISVLIVLAAASAVYRNRQKHPHLVTMGLYYLLTISPTLGLVVVGGQMMADRYAYLPSFSVFLALGWWCTGIFNKRFWTSLAVAGVLAALLGFGTVRQLSTWHDSISLWENVLRCDIHNSSAAFDNMGEAYRDSNRLDEAEYMLGIAVKIDPGTFYPHNGLGKIYLEKGLREDAAREFEKGRKINPQDGLASCYLDIIYTQGGFGKKAEAERREALDSQPDDAWAHFECGQVYEKYGFYDQAEAQILKAIHLEPDFAEAFNYLGRIYQRKNDTAKAIEALQKACNLEPRNADYLDDLADTCLRAGKPLEAMALYKKL